MVVAGIVGQEVVYKAVVVVILTWQKDLLIVELPAMSWGVMQGKRAQPFQQCSSSWTAGKGLSPGEFVESFVAVPVAGNLQQILEEWKGDLTVEMLAGECSHQIPHR